jgi:hypothetical protein
MLDLQAVHDSPRASRRSRLGSGWQSESSAKAHFLPFFLLIFLLASKHPDHTAWLHLLIYL